MSRNSGAWRWYLAASLLVALDQWTKQLVRSSFHVGESIPLIGDEFLRLTYVLNPGIAFGMPVPSSTILLIFGWTAAAALAVYLFIVVRKRDPLRWPVFLFLAGAIGNSIDRSIFREVTDFVDVDFPDFIMQRWPVFNVADSCVTIGIALLAILVLFDRRLSSHTPKHVLSSGNRSDSLSPDDRSGSTATAD